MSGDESGDASIILLTEWVHPLHRDRVAFRNLAGSCSWFCVSRRRAQWNLNETFLWGTWKREVPWTAPWLIEGNNSVNQRSSTNLKHDSAFSWKFRRCLQIVKKVYSILLQETDEE